MSIWLGNQRLDNVTTVPTNVSAFTNDAGYVTNAYHDSTKQDVATAVNYDNITNCITEIPQDIKLELSSGTLRLKAGSKVYVPNGVDNFDELVITSDITVGATSDGKYMIYVNTSHQLYAKKASGFVSGAGTPQAISDGVWYNTTANRIEWYNGAAWSGNGGRSFPIAIATVSSGAITSIDQVYNGFGYIGSTVFALPGVKGLIPNGRNEDGSLKNTEFTVPNVLTGNATSSGSFGLRISNSLLAVNTFIYNEKNNFNYITSISTENRRAQANGGIVVCSAGGTITSFTPKTAFHAVDYSDYITKSGTIIAEQLPTSGNNYTWYRKYAGGWVEQGRYFTNSTTIQYGSQGDLGSFNFPIPMQNNRYFAIASGQGYCVLMQADRSTTYYKPIFGAYTAERTLTGVSVYVCGLYA